MDVTFRILAWDQQLLPKCNGVAKNHFSCRSQLNLLLFESFYCFPIFSTLVLSLLSLLSKSYVIQILYIIQSKFGTSVQLSPVSLILCILLPSQLHHRDHRHYNITTRCLPDTAFQILFSFFKLIFEGNHFLFLHFLPASSHSQPVVLGCFPKSESINPLNLSMQKHSQIENGVA